jgi:hypothetical protein
VIDLDYIAQRQELCEKNPVIYRNIYERLSTEYQEVLRNTNYQVMQRITTGF